MERAGRYSGRMDNNATLASRNAVSWTDEFGADQLTLYPDTESGLRDAHICWVLMSQDESYLNPELVHVTMAPVSVPSF